VHIHGDVGWLDAWVNEECRGGDHDECAQTRAQRGAGFCDGEGQTRRCVTQGGGGGLKEGGEGERGRGGDVAVPQCRSVAMSQCRAERGTGGGRASVRW